MSKRTGFENSCHQKIRRLLSEGTRLDVHISSRLVSNKACGRFATIKQLASFLEAPVSTCSRYVQKLGYKSFRDFYLEYSRHCVSKLSGGHTFSEPSTGGRKTLDSKMERISQHSYQTIFVLSSRRSHSLALWMSSRLGEAKIKHQIFEEEKEKLIDWLGHVGSEDLVVLVSITGESYRVDKALRYFKTRKKDVFGVLVSSVSNVKRVPSHFIYFSSPGRSSHHSKANNWLEYNRGQENVVKTLVSLLKTIFEAVKLKDTSEIEDHDAI
ncbi:SIS domain-containing protein [Mycoplasma sp. ATU-Cv-703]|uniref:SIS domain-containing protein n=1 Tax=Mycoplasma sp. ATU-Cv-703 TaxID=2498595 RepID=UPI000FDEE7D2